MCFWKEQGCIALTASRDQLNTVNRQTKISDNPGFNVKFARFKRLSDEEKNEIIEGHSAENTNKATKCCVVCFREYLVEKDLPILEKITDADLPQVLSDFYIEIKKKQKAPPKHGKKGTKPFQNDKTEDKEYKNSCKQPWINTSKRREA